MLPIQFDTPFDFLGTFALVFGFFLVMAGLSIIKLEKVSVEPGTRTWVFGVFFVLLGMGILWIDGSPQEAVAGPGEGVPLAGDAPAESEQAGTGEPDPAIYDSFDDAAYDGAFNPDLWNLMEEDAGEGCLAYQKTGMLVMGNADDTPWQGNCVSVLRVREFGPRGDELTSVAFDVRVSSEGYFYDGGFGAGNQFHIGFSGIPDVSFSAHCGPTAHNDLWITMSAWKDDRGIYDSPEFPINFDTTYRIRFEVDPDTMTFTCYVDDQEIGSYTPDNAVELQIAHTFRHFYIERHKGSLVKVMVDNLTFYRISEAP